MSRWTGRVGSIWALAAGWAGWLLPDDGVAPDWTWPDDAVGCDGVKMPEAALLPRGSTGSPGVPLSAGAGSAGWVAAACGLVAAAEAGGVAAVVFPADLAMDAGLAFCAVGA